jgi:putative transposase
MQRSNTFCVRPRVECDGEILERLLDASASLWNELTYERRQRYFDADGYDGSVWDTPRIHDRYKGTLGSAAAKEMKRKNDEAWRSFFACLEADGQRARPPGYWGNEDDGRDLRWVGRCDQYTLVTGDRSRLEIPIGKDLKAEYGLGQQERLRLEVRGRPKWSGNPGRLEIQYDETSDQYRAIQPVTTDNSQQDQPLADETAALDIGANNIVACTTTTGQQCLYGGRELFERFRETTFDIAERQSKVKREENQYSSCRIRKLYRKRTNRRNHAMDALARDLIERLYQEGVSTVYVGDLTDVLETSWSVEANAKTHNFWAFRRFVERLACTAEEYGLSVEVRSEAWTSQQCPNCGSTEDTTRHRDTLTCPCGFEGHADLAASRTFLRRQRDEIVPRPMARPVCFEWDDHRWSELPDSPGSERESPKEVQANRSIQRTDA